MKRIVLSCLIVSLASVSAVWGAYESPGVGPDINMDPAMEAAQILQDGKNGKAVQDVRVRRPWDLWIRAFVGYDDNVQEIADATFFEGNTGSSFIGYTINGTYRLVDEHSLVAGLSLRIDQVGYLDSKEEAIPVFGYVDEANDFNLIVVNPAAFLKYRFTDQPFPMYAKAIYDFRYEDAQTGIGGLFHTVSVALGARPLPHLDVEVMYQHGWDDFDVTFIFGPLVNDRDGERDRVSLSSTYYFNNNRSRVIVGYAHMRNDSDGFNFLYEGNGISARVESALWGPLWGAAEFGYERRDYAGFISASPFVPAPGRTEMDLYKVTLQLVWQLGRHWSVDGFYNYTNYEANLAAFTSERHIVGMGVRYDF